nr:integrase, catalytic region, zinc finger, CCHC-type, peptidase aspartic, catalytic [Tanacetum cinerariifolium]
FVTLVKKSQELKTISYHKLYDILKQHQNEVNEIRADRLARTANLLALVAQQQPVYHPQNHPNHNTQYSSIRSQQATRNKGKAILNSYASIYDQEPATITKDDEILKEKEIDKLMALISLSFKKIYKPTNNNLRTSSNTNRANQKNSLRINIRTRYDNQMVVNVAGVRQNIGTKVMQKSRIQCYNCKEYGHVSKECQKPKRVKYLAYHKEKIQEVSPNPVVNSEPIFDAEPLHREQCDTNITTNSLGMCYDREHDDQDDTDELDEECTVKFRNDQIASILGYGDLVESINGKKYVLVIVDDYSRYTSKDETPEVLIDFLRVVQRGLHAQVRIVQTNKGT